MRKKTMFIWFFVFLLIMGGNISMFTVGWEAGFSLIAMGFFLAILQVFDIRRAKRAEQNTCPRCGQIMIEGSKLCTNCGFEIE